MLKLLLTLALAGTCGSLRVITRSMIRTPEDVGQAVEYEPVQLRVREAEARTLEVVEATTTETPEEQTTVQPAEETSLRKRTQLYPVAGLWEDRQLLEPDLWGILRTAYYCLFTGFDCFSNRVFPLVKSFIGYQPQYPFPRGRQLHIEEDRRLLMTKLLKELLLGLLLVNLPWLGGVGLASGKALLTSFLSPEAYYM